MADIRVKLLGDLNKGLRGIPSTLVPKYLASVTAENLAGLMKYKRHKGKHPIKLELDSTIKVDEEVQRGMTDSGTLRQEDKKVDEIRDGLLGVKGGTRMFLGTLIWNIRENGQQAFKKLLVSEEGKPPEYELAIRAPAIYLTDSAHRHFGIAEAVRLALQRPGDFPSFRSDFEFAVEIYNLDRNGERLLFNELNAKQKKITAAKQQQLDATSDIGALKDRIVTVDLEQLRLLNQNIEVNSNTNDRHTLMTMSVFTASIREMFGAGLIQEAAKDDETRDELAEYYCDFLYSLSKTIRTKVTIGGKVEEVAPFSNLYTEIISPAENEAAELDDETQAEQLLQRGREAAKKRNSDIRSEEKIHSNSFLKGLFWLGGQIRLMKDWQQVVDQIQSKLIVGAEGRYFQKQNTKLLTPNEKGVSIGQLKEDGSLNIQVQGHVVAEIKRLLSAELDLVFPIEFFYKQAGTGAIFPLSEQASSKVALLSRTAMNSLEFQLDFVCGSEAEVEKSSLRLRVIPDLGGDSWREAERKGERRLTATSLVKVGGWSHPIYGDSLSKYTATFVLEAPAFNRQTNDLFGLRLEVTAVDIRGEDSEQRFLLSCQAI